MLKHILLLGDPRLKTVSEPIKDFTNELYLIHKAKLLRTFESTKPKYPHCKALSAPQIGINKRMTAITISKKDFILINPEVIKKNDEKTEIWEECMSFPDIVVKIQRYKSIKLRYYDAKGNVNEWDNIEKPYSSIIQHEIDHLNGILAIDRAADANSIVYRNIYESNKSYFDNLLKN